MKNIHYYCINSKSNFLKLNCYCINFNYIFLISGRLSVANGPIALMEFITDTNKFINRRPGAATAAGSFSFHNNSNVISLKLTWRRAPPTFPTCFQGVQNPMRFKTRWGAKKPISFCRWHRFPLQFMAPDHSVAIKSWLRELFLSLPFKCC